LSSKAKGDVGLGLLERHMLFLGTASDATEDDEEVTSDSGSPLEMNGERGPVPIEETDDEEISVLLRS